MGTVIGPDLGRFCHRVIVIISDKQCTSFLSTFTAVYPACMVYFYWINIADLSSGICISNPPYLGASMVVVERLRKEGGKEDLTLRCSLIHLPGL